MDFAICTTAGKRILPELHLFIKSVRLFLGDVPIVITGDQAVCDAFSGNTSNIFVCYDLGGFTSSIGPSLGFEKANALRWALKFSDTALYCDTDITFLSPWKPDLKGLTLSPHFIRESSTKQYGLYNAGYIGVTRDGVDFIKWYERNLKFSKFFADQQCLDHAPWDDLFSPQHNVGWFRYTQGDGQYPFSVHLQDGCIMFNDAPLISVHSHLMRLGDYHPVCEGEAKPFNKLILEAMKKSADTRHQELLSLIGAWNI